MFHRQNYLSPESEVLNDSNLFSLVCVCHFTTPFTVSTFVRENLKSCAVRM